MAYQPESSHQVFLRQLDNPAWNLCSYCLMDRAVTFDMLEDAMNAVTRENDALRMAVDDDGSLFFFDHSDRVFSREFFDSKDAFIAWARERADESVCGCPGFWTAYLIDVNGRRGIYNIGNHIMCDALNVTNLYQKIIDKLDGKESDSISYAEHLERQEEYRASARYAKDAAYWESILREDLPCPFADSVDARCENIVLRLPEIRAFCDTYELSEAALVYSLTGVLMMRLLDLDALALGIPTLGRVTRQEMSSLGLFMRNVPMLFRGEKRFADVVRDTENCLFDLFRHQRYDLPLRRLFDISVDYSVYPASSDYDAGVIYNSYVSTAMEFHFLRSEELELTIRCRRGLFRDLRAAADAMIRLVQGALADPSRSIFAIPIAGSVPQMHHVPLPRTGLFQQIPGVEHAGRIIEGSREYCIGDLIRDAEKIDAAVRGAKRVIAVICDRSYRELAAIYGIIRGGSAYLPISPDYPEERIDTMLKACGCDTVLTDRAHRDLVAGAVVIEDILSAPAPLNIPEPAAAADDTLYVIFTSGSTGVPKGAAITNRSAVNRILWMCGRYFDSDTVVMRKTPYTFDVSVWEIFGFALGGFSLYILPPEDHYRQDRIIRHILDGGVTDIHFVPTVFHEFLQALDASGMTLPSLKNIFLSGETLSAALVNAAPAPVHNLYGPTECAVDVTYYDCDGAETDPVPIGRPIDNCGVYVLDRRLQPVPNGIDGQICISGIPVGKGYFNDPQRTEEAFVPDPFGEGRLYLTGDIGYRRDDGNLIFVGRNDQQVKINGQRIELGEIEVALTRFVSPVAVLADRGRLTAYYAADAEYPRLREELAKILPRHMIPHRFICLDKLPYTASGKIDREALSTLTVDKTVGSRIPITEAEKALVHAVEKALSLSRVATDDNFYELGGDSLSAIRVAADLQDQGYHLMITDLLKSISLAEAASKIALSAASAVEAKETPVAVSPIIDAYLYEKPDTTDRFTQSVILPVDAGEEEVRRALTQVVANHEMLRAVFFDDGTFLTAGSGYAFRTAPEAPDDAVLIDIAGGPLVYAVLYPGYLKLTIHHFAVDAVSWDIIVEDFRAALSHTSLTPERASYLEWVNLPTDNAGSVPVPPMSSLASADVSDTDERYRFEIESSRSHSAAAAFGVRINELLLAALGVAANGIAGGNAGICAETYGRDDPRFGRTVGWFTDMIPVVVNGAGADAVLSAKRALESLSDHTAGYLHAHRRLPDDASILYNYLIVPDGLTVGGFSHFPGKINVNCLESAERITIDIFVPGGKFPKRIAERLGRTFADALDALIRLSFQGGQDVSRAGRYSDSGLTAAEAEEIRRASDPEDVYALTPAQSGMYHYWDRYCLRYVLRFDSPPHADRMRRSVLAAARRHPALRSIVKKLSTGAVKLLVLPSSPALFSSSDADIRAFLTVPFRADENRLFRITQIGEYLVIDAHHIIVDGWSLAVLARDIKYYYDNPQAAVEPTVPFGRFSEWLKRQPDGIAYWRSLLSGCGVSSDLPHEGSAVGTAHQSVERSFLSPDVAAFAVRNRVTENTVLEAAFSLLLMQYHPTALFGKVLSGRNAPIPGIRDVVGAFINIVPVYAAQPDRIIEQIHEQSVMVYHYGFTPLSEMYAQTDLKRINILFVFENYPMETRIELVSVEEQTEFDLSFSVRKTADGYTCRVSYAPEKYARGTIERMISEYQQIMKDLVTGQSGILPADTAPRQYIAPENETEAEICDLFGAVVDHERVGRDDNYYDIGGTSLGMMQMLSREPLSALTPAEFMSAPTPAGLAALLNSSRAPSLLTVLYEPAAPYTAGVVLFSYAGGDAAAYTALVAEFRRRSAPVAVFYVPWLEESEYVPAAREIAALSGRISLSFYSHCAGCVTAMKMLDILNADSTVIGRYYAAASIPPLEPENIWREMSDDTIIGILIRAGMPALPGEQMSALIANFRANTSEYFAYMGHKSALTPAAVTLILSREDIFTPDYGTAAESWRRYVRYVDDVRYLDAPTHYFQSTHANDVANILLSED